MPRAPSSAAAAPCRLAAARLSSLRRPRAPIPSASRATVPPRRPDLVHQHISTSRSIVAQRSTHQPTPPAAQPAPRASPPTRRASLSPARRIRGQVATPPGDFLPDDAVQAAIINLLPQQLACSPPPIIIFCHVERPRFHRPLTKKNRPYETSLGDTVCRTAEPFLFP